THDFSFVLILIFLLFFFFFFFSSRRRHTRSDRDWSSDVCSSDLARAAAKNHVVRILPLLSDGFASARSWPEGTTASGSTQSIHRSEERRVGKECRSRWWPEH